MMTEGQVVKSSLIGREHDEMGQGIPSLQDLALTGDRNGSQGVDSFQIQIARSHEEVEEARDLVKKMYSLYGFKAKHMIQNTQNSTTMIARDPVGTIVGTITIHRDSKSEGLYSDEGYKSEIDRLRVQSRSICEFNGLAVDPNVRSPQLLAHLFHIAMLFPSEMYRVTDAIIEVSYKHAKFYERLLGFSRLGEGRYCPRVESVGVLLHRDFDEFKNKLAQGSGKIKKGLRKDRTFFLHRFSTIDPTLSLQGLRMCP